MLTARDGKGALRRSHGVQCLDCRCCLGSCVVCEWGSGRAGEGGAVSPPTDLTVRSRSRRNQMTLPK